MPAFNAFVERKKSLERRIRIKKFVFFIFGAAKNRSDASFARHATLVRVEERPFFFCSSSFHLLTLTTLTLHSSGVTWTSMDFHVKGDGAGAGRRLLMTAGATQHGDWWKDNHAQVRGRWRKKYIFVGENK